MSILYDEAQQAIAAESRRVLDARVRREDLLALVDEVGSFDRGYWRTAVEQGWTALCVPERFGGLGLGLIEQGLVAQATGRATAGAPFLTSCYGACQALLAAPDPLRERWLPQLASGNAIGAVAFAEGTDALPASPTVRYADGGLTGVKPGVVAGLAADIAVVLAGADHGPALVLVELAGATRTPLATFDGSRLYADLRLDGLPATLLASGEEARARARDILARLAVVTAHEQVGGAEALLEVARDYAMTRRAFGQPIAAFQSIKHRLAELYGLIEIARANCIHAAAREGAGDFVVAAADARLSATEAYDTAARDAVQIHGGIGVTWESGLHLHMRRARSLAIENGNMLFWEDLLVERLTGVSV